MAGNFKPSLNGSNKNLRQGIYVPKHPEKVIQGDTKEPIMFRSGWEYTAFRYCDGNSNIVRWGSEIVKIPYIHPIRGNVSNYFMDLYVEFKMNDDSIVKALIEIKPYKETIPPKRVGKNKKQQIYEEQNWIVNSAKWAATEEFCKRNGLKFLKWTEYDLVPGKINKRKR